MVQFTQASTGLIIYFNAENISAKLRQRFYEFVNERDFVLNTLRKGEADLRFNTVKLGTTASSP
jgi:hypothetical protein